MAPAPRPCPECSGESGGPTAGSAWCSSGWGFSSNDGSSPATAPARTSGSSRSAPSASARRVGGFVGRRARPTTIGQIVENPFPRTRSAMLQSPLGEVGLPTSIGRPEAVIGPGRHRASRPASGVEPCRQGGNSWFGVSSSEIPSVARRGPHRRAGRPGQRAGRGGASPSSTPSDAAPRWQGNAPFDSRTAEGFAAQPTADRPRRAPDSRSRSARRASSTSTRSRAPAGGGPARRVLTGPSGEAPADVALGFVNGNLTAFGLSSADLGTLRLVRDYADIHGTHHLYSEQSSQGIPSFDHGLDRVRSRATGVWSTCSVPRWQASSRTRPARPSRPTPP